jgi:hypothetical protein
MHVVDFANRKLLSFDEEVPRMGTPSCDVKVLERASVR